ncbi:hypothetical protein [Actinomadura macrotermitis]|uniref:Uncharacterized protein n=1 Tax=Actinomadura macrotermitis TaxID=2585200 RepID=A0A7K0C358_9ACTN|nr:hypothetical protein [Actinomadura macrotermitis]MQY07870.1 hypothetical protein [Actinomadura macrotermitis]
MAHHHKSNEQVEGSPLTGHGDGMPRRPDEDGLQERAQVDRLVAGVPLDPAEDPEAERAGAEHEAEAAHEAEDEDAGKGFPPTRYDG